MRCPGLLGRAAAPPVPTAAVLRDPEPFTTCSRLWLALGRVRLSRSAFCCTLAGGWGGENPGGVLWECPTPGLSGKLGTQGLLAGSCVFQLESPILERVLYKVRFLCKLSLCAQPRALLCVRFPDGLWPGPFIVEGSWELVFSGPSFVSIRPSFLLSICLSIHPGRACPVPTASCMRRNSHSQAYLNQPKLIQGLASSSRKPSCTAPSLLVIKPGGRGG